jgi:branched-chain amino acid transport system ATP-binding protein
MLELCELHCFYNEAHIIHGVSLNVAPGEVVALLGRNGMGKTTLIRSVMGLTPPRVRAGDIRWRGRSLVGLRPIPSPLGASRLCRRGGDCSPR